MEFIAVDPENLLKYLNRLEPNSKAAWGGMNAQRMVEHLTEMIQMSMGIGNYNLLIAEEKIESMQRFFGVRQTNGEKHHGRLCTFRLQAEARRIGIGR